MKRLLLLSTLLVSCQNTPLPQRLLQAASRRAPEAIEKRVDQARMEQHLAILSGKTALPGGSLIPERGTTQGRALARAYLLASLKALGYSPEEHSYRPGGSNILARLPAAVPSDEYIVVGAHLDSVRNAGADDNASGSVAVLEIATVLRELPGRKVNVLFAWFDEEEIGLVGSRYLARDLKKQGLKISSMHNIDMLAWDGDQDQTIELAQPDGVLWDYYNMVNRTHGLKVPFERTNTGQSDHESFHREGFDAICISEQYTHGDMTPYYHKRGDVYDTLHTGYLAGSTRLVAAVIGDLSLKVPPPAGIKQVPHSQFPSRPREFHGSYDEAAHD